MNNPILVRTTRGGVVDNIHRGCYAVVKEGRVIKSAGNIERPIHLRSSAKPLQALVVMAAAAADAFGLNEKEIAVMCGSHSGEPEHVEAVRGILEKAGLDESFLRCGVHPPLHEESRNALIKAGIPFSEVHNNCSGKHAGMLTYAKHLGAPLDDYLAWEHPIHQNILKTLSLMSEVPAERIKHGIDGCGVPSFAIPVRNQALMMARMTNPEKTDLPENVKAACRRVTAAVHAHPLMIGGHERYCTDIIEKTGKKLLEKAGANGVGLVGVLGRDMGIAVHIDDGQNGPLAAFTIRLLRFLDVLTDDEVRALDRWANQKVLNARKEVVGHMEVVHKV